MNTVASIRREYMNKKSSKTQKNPPKPASLKALTASKFSPKTRATLKPELLLEADQEIKPATRIQRKFRSLPSSNIRNPKLLTENQMRSQILYYFKVTLPVNEEFTNEGYYDDLSQQDDYDNQFVIYLVNSLPHLHDLNPDLTPLGLHELGRRNQVRIAYYLNNISYKFFHSLSNIIFTENELINIMNQDDGMGNVYDPNRHYIGSCDYTRNGSFGIFHRLLKWALMFYPKTQAALEMYGSKPSNLTNYEFAIKNILSFISGPVLKQFYIDLFRRVIIRKDKDRAKNPLFKKSSRSPEKKQAIKTIKNNKIMKRYTKKIKGKQD